MPGNRHAVVRDIAKHALEKTKANVADGFALLDDRAELLTYLTMVAVTVNREYVRMVDDIVPGVMDDLPEGDRLLVAGAIIARIVPGELRSDNPSEAAARIAQRVKLLMRHLDDAREMMPQV